MMNDWTWFQVSRVVCGEAQKDMLKRFLGGVGIKRSANEFVFKA